MQWSNLVNRDYLSNRYLGKGSFCSGLEWTCISTCHSVSLPYYCHCSYQHGPCISILSLTSLSLSLSIWNHYLGALALEWTEWLLFWNQMDTVKGTEQEPFAFLTLEMALGNFSTTDSQVIINSCVVKVDNHRHKGKIVSQNTWENYCGLISFIVK